MLQALIFVAMLLLAGATLRKRVPGFGRLYIPASVIAGGLGLVLIQLCNFSAPAVALKVAQPISETLRNWPGYLIAVVFAGMMLERQPTGDLARTGRVARQGLMVWIIVLGETAVGLLATLLLIQPFFDVPSSFGMLIETGFAGGHGTAAAMGQVFAHPTIKFESGFDLGILMATCGLVFGIVSGIVWINLAVRLGWLTPAQTGNDATEKPVPSESLIATHVRRELINPVLLQLILLTLAVGIGLALQVTVGAIAGQIDSLGSAVVSEAPPQHHAQLSNRLTASSVLDFPLFIYTLFGGMIVRKALQWIGQDARLDSTTIGYVTSTAMEVLVVAAIASLNLAAVVSMLGPFAILFTCGAIWTTLCLLVFSRWVLSRPDWFELGLINYGMSTGTTATGFVLLRVVDPELRTNAAADYALAVPLSAPFIGGGILTVGLPLLVLSRVNLIWPTAVICLLVVCLVAAGCRRSSP